ncbi:Spo0A activation inhibitor [Halorubrum salipaludis]|uniref:Spo0A activation inhibitor n=1 Tax=Halorubrum salipaludis TaxID=2032630 RepID=A0A2A2F5V1_9EURY|nr:ParA family protein [Halorubrum salipaludis]PAU79982.1 Spo0A activation inhibitor [Halorubrum salipaludis]
MRIDVGMQKGGVGKTTTSINLAGALADRGHDVLAVDADPQGGLTLKLGYREQYREGEYALYDVLSEMGRLSLDDLDELIVSGDEFDIVPSHIRNFRLEKHLYSEARGVEALKIALDRLTAEYDYVVIDSPPNLGPLADGALLAAENVLFPSNANTIAKDSLEILFDEIDTLEDKFDDVQISTVAAVLNEVGQDGVSNEMRTWFVETFGEEYVFEIPDWAAVEHAIEYRTSVFAYNPDDAGYPWDADKTDQLRTKYNAIAAQVESLNND